MAASLGTGAPGTMSAVSSDLRALSSFGSLPRTFAPGELMPNGQIAGVGPGAQYVGEFQAAKGAKPLNSPDPIKWVNEKGGTVWNELDGTWVYKDADGNIVRYPGGFPDFAGAGFVRQSVTIDMVPNRTTDFTAANAAAPLGPKLPENTWHHYQDLTTMQEVDGVIHARFTHRGAVSIMNEGE